MPYYDTFACLPLRVSEAMGDNFVRSHYAAGKALLDTIRRILWVAVRAKGITLYCGVVVDLILSFMYHPLLSVSTDAVYVTRLVACLRAPFIRMPSRALYGRTSPKCFYLDDAGWRNQYDEWYKPEMARFLVHLDCFLCAASHLGCFPFFPQFRRGGQDWQWSPKMIQAHAYSPRAPHKPGPEWSRVLRDDQVWWIPGARSRFMIRQLEVVRFLKSEMPDRPVTKVDKPPTCPPHLLWNLGHRIVILEVGKSAYEQTRMMKMSQAFGCSQNVWIRYNPDAFKSPESRKWDTMAKRHTLLKAWLEWSFTTESIAHTITVVHLFFDGFKEGSVSPQCLLE